MVDYYLRVEDVAFEHFNTSVLNLIHANYDHGKLESYDLVSGLSRHSNDVHVCPI